MKYILLLITALTVTITMAQEKNSISLNERIKYIDPNPTYQASVVISSYYANYGNSNVDAKQLIKGFEEELTSNNIDPNEVKKDETGYISLGLNKEGMLYHYQTDSKSSLLKFVRINALGSSRLSYDYVSKLDPVKEGVLVQEAIEKARLRANEIASKMNKKVGDIITLSTNYDGTKWVRGLYRDTVIGEMIFDIKIDFALVH